MVASVTEHLASIWEIVSAIGLVFVALLLLRSINDLRFLTANGLNGIRKYSAETGILIYVGGIITQIVYVLIGMIALGWISPPSVPNFIGWLFIFASASATVIAGILFYRRRRIVEMVMEQSDSKTTDKPFQENT